MDNDMPQGDAADFLLARVSAQMMQDPAPSPAELDRILAAGLCAADHGKLRPWRFIVIAGEWRMAFADLAAARLQARDPSATDAELTRTRSKVAAIPLIVGLGAHLEPDHKIPVVEQLAAVAAGAMNILNAAYALGYAAKWVTGANAYDPAVAEALGLTPPDQLTGFMFLGTPTAPLLPVRRPAVADHRVDWHG